MYAVVRSLQLAPCPAIIIPELLHQWPPAVARLPAREATRPRRRPRMRRSARIRGRSPSGPPPPPPPPVSIPEEGEEGGSGSDADEVTPTGRQPPAGVPPRSVLKSVKKSQPVVAPQGRRVRLTTMTTGEAVVHRVHSPARPSRLLGLSEPFGSPPPSPALSLLFLNQTCWLARARARSLSACCRQGNRRRCRSRRRTSEGRSGRWSSPRPCCSPRPTWAAAPTTAASRRLRRRRW
eukprot:SAG22_NODE_2021_length_3124_cov_4.616860_2_plen_236_part_00